MGLVNAVYCWPSVKVLYCIVFSMNLAGLLAVVLAILWAVRFERGFADYLNLITPGQSTYENHLQQSITVVRRRTAFNSDSFHPLISGDFLIVFPSSFLKYGLKSVESFPNLIWYRAFIYEISDRINDTQNFIYLNSS